MLGLLGVVLGALIASLAQLLMRQGERRELRRTERLSACAEFVRAAELARAAQYDRWWSTHEGRAEESHRRAKEESFNQRTGLKVARSRLRLLGVTGSVLTVADRIQAIVADLHHASNREQLEAEGSGSHDDRRVLGVRGDAFPLTRNRLDERRSGSVDLVRTVVSAGAHR